METKPSKFKSKYKAFVAVARHGHDILHPVTGTKIDEVKRIAADFGVHRGEFAYVDESDPDIQLGTAADIVGYFFDLDSAAEAQDWSADEKEAMRSRLLKIAEFWPEAVQVYQDTQVAAPWPTYDTTHHFKIPGLALELGLVEHALVYEQQTKNRDGVVKALQEKLGAEPEPSPDPEPALEEELTPAA